MKIASFASITMREFRCKRLLYLTFCLSLPSLSSNRKDKKHYLVSLIGAKSTPDNDIRPRVHYRLENSYVESRVTIEANG